MTRWRSVIGLGALCGLLVGCGDDVPSAEHPRDDSLRLNHLQAKGTHNSYHVETSDGIVDWNYTHAPLAEQLDAQGVRKLELDVHWDFDAQAHRVYHVPLVDEGSVCDRFVDCLEDVRGWSDDHRGHHPIFVQIEPKEQDGRDPEDPDDLDEWITYIEALEQEILSVFPEDRLITPDRVRGGAASLAEAIDGEGWPTLGEARGRVLFFLDCQRPFCVAYAHDGSGTDGRLVFPASEPGDPFEAVRVINDPVGRQDEIRMAVEAGRLVRTFADNVREALDEDTTRRDAALASGAHMLSSDVPAPRDDTGYVMEIPGGTPSRCNPLSAPADCIATDIEDPERLSGR
ncbi:MAG: Ca2+-dependent phosphoinositide-specific phospholipase C [Myxococcota bacterium]